MRVVPFTVPSKELPRLLQSIGLRPTPALSEKPVLLWRGRTHQADCKGLGSGRYSDLRQEKTELAAIGLRFHVEGSQETVAAA